VLTRKPDLHIGDLIPAGYSSAPYDAVAPYGQALSRTDYAGLFQVLGVTHGSSDGSTFRVPDLRGRAMFGRDDMGGSAATRVSSAGSGIAGQTLGAVGGDQLLHQHSHSVTDPGHQHGYSYGSGTSGNQYVSLLNNFTSTNTVNTAVTGISLGNSGAGSGQNMPPAIICDVWMKT